MRDRHPFTLSIAPDGRICRGARPQIAVPATTPRPPLTNDQYNMLIMQHGLPAHTRTRKQTERWLCRQEANEI